MAKKSTPPPPVGEPQIPPEQGLTLLDEQMEKGNTLASSGSVCKKDTLDWEAETKHVLELTFGKNSDPVKQVMGIPDMMTMSLRTMKQSRSAPPSQFFPHHREIDESESEREYAKYRAEDIQEQVNKLARLRKNLERELRLQQEAAPSVAPPQSQVRGNKIFLVHGHDSATKNEVADFLKKITEQRPIILQEQANKGRTIIEKFEDCASDVGFAVVLLTADDKGGPKSVPVKKQRPRARQNVVFELGYFAHALGRKRVCALYEKGVELPSDYQGVLYIEIGKGNWMLDLAKEIETAGIPLDMNKAIKT